MASGEHRPYAEQACLCGGCGPSLHPGHQGLRRPRSQGGSHSWRDKIYRQNYQNQGAS